MPKEKISIKENIALYGILTALVFVTTMLISIPLSANRGYLNLGDAAVILSGMILGPAGGFLTGGIGSALADIFLGYAQYAPFTLVIKGLEAMIGVFIFDKLFKRKHILPSAIIAGIFMGLGYLCADSLLYGYAAAVLALVGNLLQGIVGAFIASILYKAIEKIKK